MEWNFVISVFARIRHDKGLSPSYPLSGWRLGRLGHLILARFGSRGGNPDARLYCPAKRPLLTRTSSPGTISAPDPISDALSKTQLATVSNRTLSAP
jgi:hypothetical protein